MEELKLKIERVIKANNISEKSIKENLKNIFANKEHFGCLYKNEDNSYHFSFADKIKEVAMDITVIIYLTSNDDGIQKIEVESFANEISEYDLEHYYFKEIYYNITKDYLYETSDRYTVRVYYKILHDVGFKGEYIINWINDTKIRFKLLLNENRKNVIADRIIAVDCELYAKSLTHARSNAINITKDFLAYLSLLINIGFFELQSKFAHYLRKSDDKSKLISEFQRNAFYDSELKLFVMDNMNGLRHFEDYKAIETLSYLSYHFLSNDGVTIDSSLIQNNSDEQNKKLKDTFSNFVIGKSTIDTKVQNGYYREDIDLSPINSLDLRIPRQIRKYYKGILQLTGDKSTYFNNCCRLYNLSLTCGVHEPTLMLAYMVSSVECIAKSEKMSFTEFMKSYLGNEYEKAICDFLYGNLRSGHFHSGEMFFTEYNLTLDVTFESDFPKMTELYNKGKAVVRKALISWVEDNILSDKIYIKPNLL